jgi:uncharacterized protein with FMN-binding domain
MKKVILSVATILAFAAYSFRQRDVLGSSTQFSGSTVPTGAAPVSTSQSLGQSKSVYKNGVYAGSSADAFYGNVQVQVTISGGKISDVSFLDYPQDRGRSVTINTFAMPILKSETISAQSANIDTVSGATQTSRAFVESLTSALAQAK